MFGSIVKELFSDECSVLEIVPNTRYVYPIFKNGSSSLYRTGYKSIDQHKLRSLSNVEVYVRNPHERFVSGVQTFLSMLDPKLDRNTALYFVEQYFYLNRHYCPQLCWLMHLNQFANVSYTIKPIEELQSLTEFKDNQSTLDLDLVERFKNNSKIKFYNEMDEVLTVNLIGKTVYLEEIFSVLKSNYDRLYQDAFCSLKEIVNVVP